MPSQNNWTRKRRARKREIPLEKEGPEEKGPPHLDPKPRQAPKKGTQVRQAKGTRGDERTK